MLVRPLVGDDAEALFEVLADDRLYRFTGDRPPASEGALRSRFALLEHRRSPDRTQLWLNWTLHRHSDGAVVGYVQASVRADGEADVAWVVGVPFQGNGYASEAATRLVEWLVDELCILTVSAAIHPDHIASIRVAERAGLRATAEVIEGERVWRL